MWVSSCRQVIAAAARRPRGQLGHHAGDLGVEVEPPGVDLAQHQGRRPQLGDRADPKARGLGDPAVPRDRRCRRSPRTAAHRPRRSPGSRRPPRVVVLGAERRDDFLKMRRRPGVAAETPRPGDRSQPRPLRHRSRTARRHLGPAAALRRPSRVRPGIDRRLPAREDQRTQPIPAPRITGARSRRPLRRGRSAQRRRGPARTGRPTRLASPALAPGAPRDAVARVEQPPSSSRCQPNRTRLASPRSLQGPRLGRRPLGTPKLPRPRAHRPIPARRVTGARCRPSTRRGRSVQRLGHVYRDMFVCTLLFKHALQGMSDETPPAAPHGSAATTCALRGRRKLLGPPGAPPRRRGSARRARPRATLASPRIVRRRTGARARWRKRRSA